MDNTESFKESNRVLKVIGETPENIDGTDYKNANLILFDGAEYIVSHKAILTINCTHQCNAKCPFCYNGITFTNDGAFVDPKDDTLKKIIEFSRLSGVQTITFSGGEPTLLPQKLYDLANYSLPSFREGRLHTNGFRLFNEITDFNGVRKPLINGLVDAGLFGCSLSLAHYNKEENARIMRFNHIFDGLNIDQLRELAALKNRNFSPRLSCFMLSGGINSVDEIMRYIEFGAGLGFTNFMFRATTNIPGEYRKPGEFEIGNANAVNDIDPIVKTLIDIYRFREIFSLHKSDSHMHVLKNGDITVTMDQSGEEMDPDEKIRRLIYMPNKVTYSSWLDPSKILFNSDANKVYSTDVVTDPNDALCKVSCPAYTTSSLTRARMQIILAGGKFPVDLHVHTSNSDGREDFITVLQKATGNNVSVIAFAEHNFIAGDTEKTKKMAANLGVEIPVPAVEISTLFHDLDGNPERKFHVLGYGEGLLDKEFQDYIYLPNQIKLDYFEEVVENLKRDYGFELPSVEDMMRGIRPDGTYEKPNCRQINRTCIAQYLSTMLGMDIDKVKELYLPQIPHEKSYEKHLDTLDVIRKIKDLGGVSGIAHPTLTKVYGTHSDDKSRLLEILFFLKRSGMDGIESMNRYSSTEEQKTMYGFANDVGLITLGGSDYHSKSGQEIGQYGLTFEELDLIKLLLSKSS